MKNIALRYISLCLLLVSSGVVLSARDGEDIERAKSAVSRIAHGRAPMLYLVLVQDSATEQPFAGAVAAFEVSEKGARLDRSFEQGKTKWTFVAVAQMKSGTPGHLKLKARFDGWIDLGSERWISQRAAVGAGLGYSGDINANLKLGEPFLLTSSQVHNLPAESTYSETLSLFLVWK